MLVVALGGEVERVEHLVEARLVELHAEVADLEAEHLPTVKNGSKLISCGTRPTARRVTR